MTALLRGMWKVKYLFHDIEKPWLKLFMKYSDVQKFHRSHNRHHLSYKGNRGIDWEALAIDWDCGRYTKEACPRNVYEEMIYYSKEHPEYSLLLHVNLLPIIEKYFSDEIY